MTTTDANGIIRYETTDPVTPLEATLNAGLDSVSAAIDLVKRGLINTVANTTERTELSDAFGPTASKPLYVHRTDATAGYNLEYTINGIDWFSIRGPVTRVRNVTPTASGALSTGAVQLGPVQTIPINPFGQGQNYWVRVYGAAILSCPAPNRGVVETTVDSSVLDFTEISGGSSSVQVRGDCSKGMLITNPNITHTVGVQVRMISGSGTVVGGSGSVFQVELTPAATF